VNLYVLEQVRSAERLLQHAVKIHPLNPDSWNQLAIIARERGDYWRALRCLRRAIRLSPSHASAHFNLSQLHRYNPKSRHLRELDQQLQRLDLLSTDRILLVYAMAKAHDDCGQYEEALGLYLSASQMKLSLLENFNLHTHVQFLLNRNSLFSLHLKQWAKPSNPTDSFPLQHTAHDSDHRPPIPIFIIGLPRCGSTLVEQILSSTPACQNLGESKLFGDAMHEAKISHNEPPPQQLDRQQIQTARDYYYGNLPAQVSNATWVTDKMLYNYTFVELLKVIFPECRIIAMKRHPLDAFLSMLKCNFSEGNQWTYSFDSMLEIYDSYSRFMKLAVSLLPSHLTVLQYEQLVQQPEQTLRQLTHFLGMPWSSTFLKHHRIPRSIRTASDLRARQAIDLTSVDNWIPYSAALELIRSKLLALGYLTIP
jgi:tetratricopeptide (TPR) repeat protein